jgi:hypothetical protein
MSSTSTAAGRPSGTTATTAAAAVEDAPAERPAAKRGAGAARRQSAILDPRIEHRVRRHFFAQEGWIADRYGIDAEHLLDHLRRHQTVSDAVLLRSLNWVGDLALAVACLEDRAVAWLDATERFEPLLVRACLLRMDELSALIAVRGFLSQLRRTLAEPRGPAAPRSRTAAEARLSGYLGTRPLRAWMVDALMAHLDSPEGQVASTDRQRAAPGPAIRWGLLRLVP